MYLQIHVFNSKHISNMTKIRCHKLAQTMTNSQNSTERQNKQQAYKQARLVTANFLTHDGVLCWVMQFIIHHRHILTILLLVDLASKI